MQDRRKGTGIFSLVVWILITWISPVSVAAQSDEQAQIEKGRQAMGQACVPCHNNIARVIQLHKKSREEWRNTVYSMIGRGAFIFPEEIEPLAAFLAANAGRNLGQSASATPGQGLPEAEGKSILERSCQQCHDLATATKKLAADDWKTVVDKMVTYGAIVTPADQQKLIEYLSGLTK